MCKFLKVKTLLVIKLAILWNCVVINLCYAELNQVGSNKNNPKPVLLESVKPLKIRYSPSRYIQSTSEMHTNQTDTIHQKFVQPKIVEVQEEEEEEKKIVLSNYEEKKFQVKAENTIISLSLNDKLYYDFEVYINPNATFSLPIKTTAELFGYHAKQNHVNKSISFVTEDGTSVLIDIKNQRIVMGNNAIDFQENSQLKMKYIKEGLLEDTKDEVFIPVKVAAKILNATIKSDFSNYSVKISSSKLIKALVQYDKNQINQDPFSNSKVPDVSFSKLIKPEKKRLFSIDTLEFENRSQYYQSKIINLESIQSDALTNNVSRQTLRGNLLGGEYQISTYSLINNTKLLSFGGISFHYDKKVNGLELKLGKLEGIKTDNYNILNQAYGFRLGKLRPEGQNSFRNLSGLVKSNSKIKVYINENPPVLLDTYGGYYDLKDFPGVSEKVQKVRLEEVSLDGQVTTVKEKTYPLDVILLPKRGKEFEVFAGITGLNDSLFSSYAYTFNGLSKKIAGGVRYSQALTDKLTVNTYTIADRIIYIKNQNPFNSVFYQDGLLSLLVNNNRQLDQVNGETGLLNFNYIPCNNFKLSSSLGLSHATTQKQSDLNDFRSVGYMASLSAVLHNSKYKVYGRLFSGSPGFYLAGTSSSSNVSNKLGVEIGTTFGLRRLTFNGNYKKYFSNLDEYLPGGKYKFDVYNCRIDYTLDDGSRLSYTLRRRLGSNFTGNILDKSTEFRVEKKFNQQLRFKLSHRVNDFNANYSDIKNQSKSYTSKYNVSTAELDYHVSDKVGSISVSHDIVKSNYQNIANSFNSLRIGYTPPILKGVITSGSLGYHYKGINKGLDCSLNLGYRFKSGRSITLGYSYNRDLGYFFDNIFIPKTSRHSVQINFQDAFGFLAGKIQSLGTVVKNQGFIEVTAFLDVNKDGVYDKNEPAIPNIAIHVPDKLDTIYTNQNGQYIAKGMAKGVHKVKLEYEKLPALLSMSPSSDLEYLVKVNKRSRTKVYFGLISAIGNISGKVDIRDRYGRLLTYENIVIGIYDFNGKEINYTTIDLDGHYDIAGLTPGKYIVKVDPNILDAYKLDYIGHKTYEINIPPLYDDYYDLSDINFDLIKT